MMTPLKLAPKAVNENVSKAIVANSVVVLIFMFSPFLESLLEICFNPEFSTPYTHVLIARRMPIRIESHDLATAWKNGRWQRRRENAGGGLGRLRNPVMPDRHL